MLLPKRTKSGSSKWENSLLAKAIHESKASEIQYRLRQVSDRWQHLLDLIAARVEKLKETPWQCTCWTRTWAA